MKCTKTFQPLKRILTGAAASTLLACKAVGPSSSAQGFYTETVTSEHFPAAVGQIRLKFQGQVVELGMGFWIKPDVFVTGAHVVDRYTSFDIGYLGPDGFVVEASVDTNVDQVHLDPAFTSDQAAPTDHDLSCDLAAIQLHQASPLRNPSNLARFAAQGVAAGDQVQVVSHIKHLSGDLSKMTLQMGKAKVSRLDPAAHGIVLTDSGGTQAMPGRGDSGSALFNSDGDVVGVQQSIQFDKQRPAVARYVNIHDLVPGTWLSQILGAEIFSPSGYEAKVPDGLDSSRHDETSRDSRDQAAPVSPDEDATGADAGRARKL